MSGGNPSDTPQHLLTEAVRLLHAGRPEAAEQLASRAIQAGLDSASAWGVLAIASRDAGNYGQARSAADRSIAHEGRNPRAYVVKGDAFYAEKNFRAAAAFYRQAQAYGPLPAGSPPDMLEDMQRAAARTAELQDAFAEHLDGFVREFLEDSANRTERMGDAVELLMGRKKLYYPEPHHLMYPGLPVRPFYPNDLFPWLGPLEAASDAIRQELDALLDARASFDPYLHADDERPLFDTHGMAGNADWGAYYLWRNGEALPANQARCPQTTAAIRQLPLVFSGKRCPNVFFSRLKAGATIPPHTGMINTRLIGHLPLIVPERCGFRVGNDVRQWQAGEAWLFDDTIEHEAWNHSSQDRVILIFEVWKPELTATEQQFVTRLLEAVDSYT